MSIDEHIKNLEEYCQDDDLFEKDGDFKEFCDGHIADIKAVIKELKNTQSDLYEANHRISDLLDIVEQKDQLIKQLCIGIREHDSLEDTICPLTEPLDCHDINKDGTCIDCIIEFYKRGVDNAKD